MEKKKILLVDDDALVLSVLGKVLDDAGFQTERAEDGEQALALLEEEHFDLVVTDIYMPGKNGIELASTIKQHYKETPVLAISAKFDDDSAADTLGLTSYFADDSLAKPVEKEDLLAAVNGLLSNCGVLAYYG